MCPIEVKHMPFGMVVMNFDPTSNQLCSIQDIQSSSYYIGMHTFSKGSFGEGGGGRGS